MVASGQLPPRRPDHPASWTASLDQDGDLHLEPTAWQEPSFWVDHHDDVPAAVATYAEHRHTPPG